MAIGDVVELVAALLLSLAVWALSAAEYLLSALQNAVFGNQQLDQPGGDRHQLLEWVRTQLPDQPVHDFGAGWRDGVALRRLVDRLVTGHPSVTGRPEVTADRPVLNVNEAFRRARDVLHQPPTLTVTDVISGCDEDRLAAYVAALREAAERRGEPEHPPETPADMAEPPAAAAGTGLTAAHTGQPAQFAVRLPQAARLDLLVEMRSETGDYFSQRLTPRSPARRSLEDEAPAPVSSSGRPRSNIPVGYQVTGRTVNLWYQPPAAGWLSLSIVSGGQHVEGSPFRVYVGENEEEEGTVDDSDKKSEKDEVKEEVAKEVEKLVDAGLESVTEPIKELSEKPVKDSVIEDGKEHSERVADEPAGEEIKATVVETVKQPEPDSVAEAVVEAVKAKVSEAAVKAAEEEATEAAGKEVEGPAGPEEKEQDETVESSLDEQVQKLSMTQSESEPADERAEKVVEDSVKDSDKISAAEAVEQPLEECSVETAGEPLVAEEKEPEDEAASESVVEAPEVATEVVERAKNIVSETIEKALQQIPLNASQKTVVDAEVAEVIEDVVGSAAEGKGESSEGSTTESPEEIGEPAAKEVRELEEKEEMKEPLTEVIEANQATARTEAVPSPTRRTPPLRLLSTVQEMSVDVLVPTADDVHPDNVTPNSPILEEQKEGEKSENQENNQNEDRKPSTPIEQLSDQPDTLPTPAPHSGDKVSSDPNAEQDPLAEPESPGAAASKDAATTTTIPTGEFPEAAAAVSPRQVSEPKQRSLEQTAAALVAAVVSAAEAALASVDAGGDADQSAQTPNEHNEPNHPDGKPNELAEINASAAEKTEDVEEVVMPDASQVSPEPSDSPDDIPDVQIHDKDSQPEINHVSENSAELAVNAEPASNHEAQHSENQTEPVLARQVNEALESQIMPTKVSPVNAQDDNHTGKDTIPVHSDKPTTPKPSRKISWQERVVVADTFDNAEADEADEEAEELFTPMSPVHEYTPSPPLYRRNTFDELVAVTDVPNSESKREVKIQQKRKLSRKESRLRHSRSRSSSGDLESPVPKDSCIERNEHPLNFALDKDVSDEEKHSAAAVDVAAVQVVAAERLPDEKVLDQSDHSNEKTEAAVKHEKNRKISFIEKIDVIEVPVVKPEDSKTEEKFDPHPKLVIQDSIDEPADWIHAPLSESKKELEVLEKVCEDNEEQTESQLPLQSDTNITPMNDKDVQSAADKTPAEPFEQPNGNRQPSVETPANEEQSEDKATLSHVIDRSRLLQKNIILSMSTSSSDSDEEAAHMSDGQRKKSQKTSDESSSSSDDGKSSASKAAVKSDDKNEPKLDTNDGAVKEHKEEGIPKRVGHDESSSPSEGDDANEALQKEKTVPSSTASGQGHPCVPLEDTSAKKKTKSNSEGSESSTSSSDKNEATKNASQNKKKKKKKRRKRSSGSSSSSDDSSVTKQSRKKDKAKPKLTSSGSSSSSSDDSKAKAEKLQQKKKETSSSSSDTDKHESSAEKGASKKDDVSERSKTSSGSEKRASKSRSVSSSSSGSSLDHNGSQKEASKEDKPASKPESRKSSTSSSDNNKKGEALQEEKDRPNTSDSSTSSSSSDDSSTEKKLPKKDSRKTTSRSSRSSNSSSDDKDAAVEAATKKEEAKSSSKSSSSSSSDEGKCDKKRSMKDKAMPKRATSRSSSSCSDDREGKGNTTQQRNATVKPKCSESADTSSNADSDREGFSKEEKAKLKKQSSKSSSSSSDDNAATTEVKRKNKSKSSSTTSTSSSSSTDDDKAQNKALKKKKNTSRSASSSSSSDGSKRNKSTSQKKKAQSGQATSSSSSSSSDDSSVEQKDAKKDKSNMKSASPKGSSSTSDEETRKRHTSPKPANSKDSSSSAEDNVTCGNYANEKEKSKKRELSPARTSSHSETKSACQGSNAEKESMLEEQVKLRSSSSISSSTSEDEGKPLDRSRENAAMTEKQDDMPHTDDISDDRNQIKLEVCVNEQPSSSVADDIESQVKLPSLELATTSDVSENKAAENDTEVKDKYVPSSAETLEVKVNILAETGDSAQETAPETEAIKNIEVSVDISLGQQLVRSRSDVEDDAETQERPMTVTVLPSCAHIRPDEPKSKGRSDSESSSISEEIGVQEETQKTGTCTETPVIRDTTPGDSLGENKTGDEVEVPIDVDQELDFDVVGLVSNVVNESRSPVHLTTQGEIQDSPVIVEKIVTDVTQENAPLGKDDALERRSSTSSESSSSGSDGEKGGKMNVDAPISDLVPTSKEDVIVRCDEQKTENQPAAPMPKSEVLEDSAEEQQVDAGKNDMQDSPLPSTNETSSPKSEEETQQSKETSEPNQSFSDNEYQTKETNLPTFAVDDQTGKQWRKKSRTSDTSSSSSPSDDSEDSIKAKTSEAAHEKIVRASSSSSSSETSAEQDEKLSPEKTPNVIEDLCDAIIPEKPSSASHEDKNVVKKEGSNEKKNDVKTEDPTVSNTSSSSHSSESSVDDHRRDSAEHNEKQDMVKQEDEPSTVSLDIEVDIMKEVDKPAGESGKSPEPETSVVLETHMASQFAVAEEFPSSDSEDQEAHEVIIGIDKVEPTQAVERQSPPATEVVNAEMEAENGIDDGTFGKKERTTVEVASSCDEGERNSVPESQDDSLAILVTKIVPNENESQEEILTEVTKSELDQTPQHIPTPLDDISQLPVSVPKEEISLFQSPECLSETPKTIAESFDNKTETQESLKPAAPSSLPASTKPSRKYSDQYSNFETPRDSRYRLQDMQERSKSSVGQQRTRIRPQVEVTSAVLPCLVEVRTALPPSGIPSEVLENMENVTDVMKEEKPPKVAELIVPETLTNVNQGNKEMESLPVGDNVVEVSLEQHLSAMDEKHSPAAVSSSSSSSSDSEENKAKTDKSQDCEKEKKTPKKETERKSRASSSSTSSSSDSDENRKRRKTSRKSSSSSSDSSARKHKIDKRKDSASKQPVAVKKEKQKRSSSSSSSDSHEKRQHRKSDTLATAEVGDKVAISTSSDSSSDEGATKSHRRNSVEKEGRKPSSSDKEETAPDLKDKRKPTKTSSSSGTSSSSSSSSSDENAKPEKEASKSSSSTSSSSSSSEDDVKNSHTHDRRKKKSHGSSSDDTEVKKSTEKKEKVNRSGSSVSSSSDKEGSQAKTSGSEKGHPSRPHKTSESSKSSDSSSSDSRSSDSENEAKKRKDVSSVPDVKEATDEPHPKLPLAPPPTSRLPLQTSRDEEILEIVEKVLEDSEIGSLDRNAPSSAIHESIDGKNDADQMKDDALPTSDQNGLEDWVIVPETVDETQAAPHIVNEKTRDPELTQHESSNLHGPTPETISKEEPVEGERGQPVSEWVNMWDSAISAGLYPTPTADVSKRLQELHSEPQQPEAASNAKQSDPETATKPEDAPSGSSSVEAPQVIAKEEAGIVRAEPARLIEDEPCVDTNVSEQPPVSGVEGAFEAILVNVVPELPIDDNQSKVEKNSEDLDKPSEKTIRDKTEDETYQASLCYIDPELPSPVEKDGDADNTCPDLMRPEDTLSESLPAFVREPVPAVWRRASVDRQVGKFNITCIIRPNEAHLHGSETRVTPPRQTDRKWLNLENYTIMPPPQSPESVRKNTAESDLGSKTTVYLTPRSPPNARQELVALRCVRNSEDDSSLTYLPELRDLTPDIGDGEKSFHWNGRSKEVDKSTVPHLHSQPPLADVKKKRLAYENGSSAAHKELRKVTPPHNANLEERKQKLLGSTTDIVSKVKQPVAEPGKVGRLRAMFEQMDAAAARAPGRDETLRDSRRFKSMMNVTAPSTTGRSSRLEEPTLKERSRSTAALHRAPSGGLGAELSVAPESVKERSRSTVNLNHREGDEKPSWDAVDSGSIKHRSRSTVGLNGTSSASPRAGLSAAPDSVKERSRSAATLHKPEKADKGEDAVDSAPAKERSPSVPRQPEGSLSPQGPTGHDSPPASSEYVTLEERALSSRALDELEDGDHQAKLDAIRRYFEGLQDGDITAGDDMDMLDDALVPDRGYNRSLPRLDASASDRRPPLTDLFTEPERGTRSLNRSASSPLVSAEGAGGAATLLDQVRQLRRRRASGGALSQTSLTTSIASTAELARHRDDGIVVFGPGMCQGKVSAVNRFQILVPHADQAPMGVRLYSQRTDSVTRVELRDLGCDYHQVAYRVNQPGWYRLYVRLGGGARHVDLMTKVSH